MPFGEEELDPHGECAAEIARLRKGIQDYLDGRYGRYGEQKTDLCPHERFGYEMCGLCIDDHFTKLLDGNG